MPVFQLTRELAFPSPEQSADEGLLAVGGDLSVDRLLLAYSMGIFPWYSEGEPILWWSPNPRMILLPDEYAPSRSLARLLKGESFQVTMDSAFTEVIEACAKAHRPGQDGTWITHDMKHAYTDLHRAGYAHSVECWQDDRLVGGLYGVSLGACFFGESMFARVSNASKVAFARLVEQLAAWSFTLIDCQIYTEHLERLGAIQIPRSEFIERLRVGLQSDTRRGSWRPTQ